MKIQVVDDQDQVIGIKERNDIDFDSDIYRVSALWITNSKNQALLAKRATTKDKDPGKWQSAVAGTVDEGETYDMNIYKEAMEEIGLNGVQFTKGIKTYTKYPYSFFCQWYFVTLDRDITEFTVQEVEVDALEWVDIAQLKVEAQTNSEKYIPSMSLLLSELGV